MRVAILSAVVLPAPFGPIRPNDCPSGISNDTSSSARTTLRGAGEVVTQRAVLARTAVVLRDVFEGECRRHLVPLPVMLSSFSVASTKRCKDAGSLNSRSYWGDRGRGSAPRDRGRGAGVYCWMGH